MSSKKPSLGATISGGAMLIGLGVMGLWPGLTAKLVGLGTFTLGVVGALPEREASNQHTVNMLVAGALFFAGIFVLFHADVWWEYVVGGLLVLSPSYAT